MHGLLRVESTQIRRFDGRGRAAAPIGGIDPDTHRMVRVLRDDGVLHSHVGAGGVVRRDGRALALDPDGRSFWSVSASGIARIALQDGSILRGPLPLPAGLASVFSIAVAPDPAAGDVPALTPFFLPILAAALAFLALRRTF